VFCGAKQAPAPAVQPGLAKTAFGYSANEVMQQLGNQPGHPYQPPQQQAYQAPRPQGGSQPPPMQQPYPPAGGYPPGGLAPASSAHAATMMVAPGGGPPPAAAYTPPVPQYGNPSPGYGGSPDYTPPAPLSSGPMGGGGMGIHSLQQATPAPLPAAQRPPYLASQTAARAGRPIEPWKDSLRFMMFVWGAVALAAFATPMSVDPMGFNWDLIIDGPGTMKIPPLVWAAVGLLSIVFAAIPMVTLPRGILAVVLGLSGIFVPLAVTEFPPVLKLLPVIGSLVLVPGLLVRHEYVESLLARILVTIGVVCTLVPYLIPDHGQIPLVQLVKALIEAGSHMEIVILALAQIVLVVLCLLVWMPGPATAGAKIFAWALILFPIAAFALTLLGRGHLGDVISKSPGMLMVWAPNVVYSVLVGYGGATVIGKQLE
jgi:hypothetical protein